MEELTISYFREPGKESKRIWGRSEGCTNAEECERVARGETSVDQDPVLDY